MFKKLFLALLVVVLLAGGAGFAWFKFMRPIDPFAAAKIALEKGDVRTAQIELRNAVRNNPNNAEAHFRLALLQLRSGDAVAAERSLRQARDNGFDPRSVAPLMARAYMAQGKFRDLLRDFGAEGMPAEQAAQMLLLRGSAHLQLGELDPALAAFTDAEKLAPQSAEPMLAAARVMLGKRDLAGAEARVDRALAMNAKSADALVLKAQLLNMKGDRRSALSALDSAIQNAPNMMSARLERANLLVAMGEDAKANEDVSAVLRVEPRSAGAVYLQAVLSARGRDFAAADQALTKLGPLIARFPRGYYFLAVVKFNLGQGEQAADAAGKFVSRNPTDPEGVKLAARIAIASQRPEQAVDLIVKAQTGGLPEDAELMDLLGRAYAQTRRPQLALQSYERAAALEPDNADILTRLAAVRLGLGDAGGATRDLEQSVGLAPDRMNANEALVVAALASGDIAKASGALDNAREAGLKGEGLAILEGMVRTAELNFEGAEAAFTEALRDNPGSVRARLNLARVAAMMGRNAEAERYLAEVLKQEPAHEQALGTLVNMYLADGRLARAVPLVEAARAAAPGNAGIAVALAELYLRAKEGRRALEMLEQAEQVQPKNPQLVNARARAQIALGMLRDAATTYRALLAENPNNVAVRRALVEVLVQDSGRDAARVLLREGLASQPANPALIQALVALDMREGEVEPALATLAALQQDPQSLPATRGLKGDIYFTAKRYNEAAAAYVEDLREAARPDLVNRAVSALTNAGRTGDARKLLQEWLSRMPDDQNAAMRLISLDLAEKRLTEAEAGLQQFLARSPNNPIALNNLAWLYHQRNDDRALPTAQRAYLMSPSAQIADTFGWIMTARGDAVKALPLLGLASRQLPNEPTVQFHYAVALKEVGRNEEAVAVLRPIVTSAAAFEEKAEATRLLETLSRR